MNTIMYLALAFWSTVVTSSGVHMIRKSDDKTWKPPTIVKASMILTLIISVVAMALLGYKMVTGKKIQNTLRVGPVNNMRMNAAPQAVRPVNSGMTPSPIPQ